MTPTSPERSADAWLREARTRVDPADAEWLLLHALRATRPGREYDRSWLFAHGDEAVAGDVAATFVDCLQRREAGEPVAYIIGRRGFRALDLRVTPDVLIPRPDTELLVELALARIDIDRAIRVADLGTGSGAVALALAGERPRAQVVATDFSAAALAVARQNAAAHALDRVEFREGSWWTPLAGERFDVIVTNPPYIVADDPHLSALRHEPAQALVSGADGLDAIRTIVSGASVHLEPGGWLLLEHGWDQGAAVRALLHDAGLVDVATERDLEARDRVTLGRWTCA